MLEFYARDGIQVLRYSPLYGAQDLYDRLEKGESITIKRTFHFEFTHLLSKRASDEDTEPLEFCIGNDVNNHIVFLKEVLNIKYLLRIHNSITLNHKLFVAPRDVAIFPIINEFKIESLTIGGSDPDSLPANAFRKIIGQLPSLHELRKYTLARVSSVLREHISTASDLEDKYNKFLSRRLTSSGPKIESTLREFEIHKFSALHSRLEYILKNEDAFSEVQWQDEILGILLLIFPKYIKVFKSAPLKDSTKNKKRQIDLLLLDASGNADIVEIKKPFKNCIVTSGRYRDNHIPLHELSGSIMQIEKYIFHLNRWGAQGEEFLTNKYKADLPTGFSVKITNPQGLVIMGRSNNLTPAQAADFEVIKRQYKSIIDIISYDDLLARLKFTLAQLKRDSPSS